MKIIEANLPQEKKDYINDAHQKNRSIGKRLHYKTETKMKGSSGQI